MQGLGRGVVYVSRRAGNKGDTNGKSGNINSWGAPAVPCGEGSCAGTASSGDCNACMSLSSSFNIPYAVVRA